MFKLTIGFFKNVSSYLHLDFYILLPFIINIFEKSVLNWFFSSIISLNCLSFTYAMLCYAKSLQSCPTLCDPIGSSPPGSSVPGVLQARTLEWVAISFSNAGKWKVKVKSLSCVRLSVTPWTAAYQAPLSMGFSRQEYWSGVPLPSSLWLYGSQQTVENSERDGPDLGLEISNSLMVMNSLTGLS